MTEFFDTLSFECASQYIAKINKYYCIALFHTNASLTKIMIKYGTSINIRDAWRETLLTGECSGWCGEPRDIEKIKFLLDNKIDVNARNNGGQTALMCSCASLKYDNREIIEEIIELLIFNGAITSIESFCDRVALDFVSDKILLSEKTLQLLQGTIKMNSTKRATQ